MNMGFEIQKQILKSSVKGAVGFVTMSREERKECVEAVREVSECLDKAGDELLIEAVLSPSPLGIVGGTLGLTAKNAAFIGKGLSSWYNKVVRY